MPIFAFTDIEGSTGLWERHQDAMGQVIARHYAILEKALALHGGKIIKKTGDGIFALFPDESGEGPSEALQCAIELQRSFQEEAWPVVGELRVRMAFHCGQAEEMAGDYYGPTANRTARFMSLGWGGQILVSEDLKERSVLPIGAEWLDLGIHMVKDLPEPQHIYSLAHPSLKLREFPVLKSLSTKPHNLPEQLIPFVGRRKELADIAALLAKPEVRLLTLLGAAGMGKSRLAIQAALDNVGIFKNGVHRVILHGLDSPEQFPARLAESLKVGPYREKVRWEQVLEYLADKKMLLILDPCERLGAGAALVTEILQSCPGLRVMACSRRPLNLRAETVIHVKGLDFPQAAAEGLESSGCARLFIGLVRAFKPGYTLGPEDQEHFVRICKALQGMPLALELAADSIRSVALKVLADRIEKDPRFLSSARPDLPQSHHSLKNLFESAWAQQSPQEKKALSELALFWGGFTAQAAQLVFKVRPEALSALAEQGMLEQAGDGRYAMPEANRLFASAKLDLNPSQRDAALDMHARYFCRFLKDRERQVAGYDQAKAVAEIRQELPNVQRAWERAVVMGWAREIAQAARCLGMFSAMQGLAREWEPRLERALQLWDDPSRLESMGREEALSGQAGLLAGLGDYAFSLGQGVQARTLMERSLALCKQAGSRSGAAYALVRLAIFMGPEDERRRVALEEAANLSQAAGDSNGAAWARRNLGYLLCLQGRIAEGKPLLEASLAVFHKVGNLREIGWSLNSLGQAALEEGHPLEGMQSLREARDIFLQLGDLETAAWTLHRLGRAAMSQKAWAEGRAELEQSLELFGRIRHARGRSQALRSLCEILAAQGDLETAFEIVDKAIVEAQGRNDAAGQAAALIQKGQLLTGKGEFDKALASFGGAQAAFSRAGSEAGQALAMECQAVARLQQGQATVARNLLEQACQKCALAQLREPEARLCVRLGDLDASEGKPQGGESWYKRALRLSRQHKPGDYSLGAMMGLSLHLLKQGRKLEAMGLALSCERCLALGIMPASDPEFYAELVRKSEALMAQVGSKLLHTVLDEARARMASQDARGLLKENLEKNWT
jgi:class 3 adenylate cyclase/predicted ATPase